MHAGGRVRGGSGTQHEAAGERADVVMARCSLSFSSSLGPAWKQASADDAPAIAVRGGIWLGLRDNGRAAKARVGGQVGSPTTPRLALSQSRSAKAGQHHPHPHPPTPFPSTLGPPGASILKARTKRNHATAAANSRHTRPLRTSAQHSVASGCRPFNGQASPPRALLLHHACSHRPGSCPSSTSPPSPPQSSSTPRTRIQNPAPAAD